MQEIHLDTIQQFNDYNGMETLLPLVSVIHVDNTEQIKEVPNCLARELVESGMSEEELQSMIPLLDKFIQVVEESEK